MKYPIFPSHLLQVPMIYPTRLLDTRFLEEQLDIFFSYNPIIFQFLQLQGKHSVLTITHLFQ